MNKTRHERNEKIIDHIERLGTVYDKLMSVQPGQDAPSRYEGNDILEAMKRLSKEIGTDAAEPSADSKEVPF